MRFRTSKAKKLGWRFWINRDDYRSPELTGELYLLGSSSSSTSGFNIEFNADCEGTISLSCGIHKLIACYLTLDASFGYKDWWRSLLRLDHEHRHEGRVFGIRWCHNVDGCTSGPSLDIKLGSFPNSWSRKDPKWLSTSFYPEKWIFGKCEYKHEPVKTTKHLVTIKAGRSYSEKDYELTCIEFKSSWTWPRFRKPLIMTRFEVKTDEPGGVPHPGKGTCDYNCDEGGLVSETSASKTAEEAVDKFVEQVYWYRKNYPL